MHEQASGEILNAITPLLLAFIMFSLYVFSRRMAALKAQILKTDISPSTIQSALNLVLGNPRVDPEVAYRRGRYAFYGFCFYFILTGAMALANFVSITYTANAAAYYYQVRAIIRPFIAETDAQFLDMRFASIYRSSDYTSLLDDMKRIAKAKGRPTPYFSQW